MATSRVVGGPPSVSDTISSMNQSIGQMMSFVQNKKLLEEQTREFNVGKGLDQIDKLAQHFGGYNIMAQEMGTDLPELMKSFGLDPLQADQLSKGYAGIQLTPQQITSRTILEATNKGLNSPEFQRLMQLGGDMTAPEVRTGVTPVAGKALDIAGGFLEGFGGQDGVPAVDTQEPPPEAPPVVEPPPEDEDVPKVEKPIDEGKISLLQDAYAEALRVANLSANAPNKGEFLKQAEGIKKEIEDLGGNVLREDISKEPELTQEEKDIFSENYQLQGRVSSVESSYVSKFAREPIGGIVPTGFQDKEIPDALNGGIPVTKAEFNRIQSPSLKDSSNLRLAEDFKTAAIPDDKRNSVLNLMDGTYVPSPIEGATLLKSYEEKAIAYQAEVRKGNVPPLPAGVRRANEALYMVSKAFVDEVPLNQVPRPVQQIAMREVAKNATTQQVRDNLMENIDMIIQVSKNPAMATYFMPTAEANRLENKQLAQADARLLANKDITSTNQLMGILNFLRVTMSDGSEGSEGELLAYKAAEKVYLDIQSNTDLSAEQKAATVNGNVLAKSIEEIYGTLLGDAVGRPTGMTDVQYRSRIKAFMGKVGGFLLGTSTGVVETFTFTPMQPIQGPAVDTTAGGSILGNIVY